MQVVKTLVFFKLTIQLNYFTININYKTIRRFRQNMEVIIKYNNDMSYLQY